MSEYAGVALESIIHAKRTEQASNSRWIPLSVAEMSVLRLCLILSEKGADVCTNSNCSKLEKKTMHVPSKSSV